MVSDHKSIDFIVFREIRISFLEILDLLRIEYMNLFLKSGESTIFSESVHQPIPVDRGSLNAN